MAELRIDIEASAQKIISKIEERFGIPAERLLELVQADRDGRCVVLPCKIGDTVFQVDAERIYEMQIQKIIYACGHIAFGDDTIGKYVFLTREAAEAALKEVGLQK